MIKIGKTGIVSESNKPIDDNDGYMDPNGIRKESWQINYESGTNYELYRILLKHEKFEGLRFKDVCMILFHKLGLVLIALEVKVLN